MEFEPIPIISSDFVKIVIPLIDQAVHSIDIIVFEWRFYRKGLENNVCKFNYAIVRAVNRGVRVRCLVQQKNAVAELIRLGCKARKLNTKRLLHCKLMILDNRYIILGSHNYTQHAFSSNHEASIFVEMKDDNNTLVQYFNNLYGL
jgi:phosphatidylserine/phosphatidylglycerophosphate/cardiolipin synthase-like enzyme